MFKFRGKTLILSVVLGMVLGLFAGSMAFAKDKLVVGAKNFTEQYIVGNMMSLLLQENGFDVDEKFGTGSTVTRQGLVTGQTDLYAEYTGTAWAVYLKHDEKANDPNELYEKVKAEDLKQNQIVWLDRAPLNNTYALAIRKADVEKYGKSLSELAEYVNTHKGALLFGIDHEFYERADGFWKMAEEYGMEAQEKDVKTMDIGLSFESINRGQIDVAMVFATDGKLAKYNLKVLDDDKQFFPVYNLSVTVRQDVLNEHPEIEQILAPIATYLDNETMQGLNYRVDAEGIPAKIVAKEFLKENGLID